MSIATVVTRGFGSFGTIAYVVRQGYDGSTVPPPPPVVKDTHDGWYSREEVDAIRRNIERVEDARRISDKRRRQEEQRFEDTLRKAFRRIVERLPDEEIAGAFPAAVLQAASIPVVKSDGLQQGQPNWGLLARDLDAMRRMLAIIEQNRQTEAWLAADEDDIEMLLMAMT